MLNHRAGSHGAAAMAVITLPRQALTAILMTGGDLRAAVADGRIAVSGDVAAVDRWLAAMDNFDPNFNVIEP